MQFPCDRFCRIAEERPRAAESIPWKEREVILWRFPTTGKDAVVKLRSATWSCTQPMAQLQFILTYASSLWLQVRYWVSLITHVRATVRIGSSTATKVTLLDSRLWGLAWPHSSRTVRRQCNVQCSMFAVVNTTANSSIHLRICSILCGVSQAA